MSRFEVIAFDADDTLWHSERLYVDAQARFKQLLAQYHRPEWIEQRLYQTEMRNLQHFGYGVKGFALSMIETAVELTEGRIAGGDIQILIDPRRRCSRRMSSCLSTRPRHWQAWRIGTR